MASPCETSLFIMRQSALTMLLGCLCSLSFAQRVLVLTDQKTGKTMEVRGGDKVILAFKTTQREVDNQPADVFVLRPQDLQDSIFVHVKTRILLVTDSTIVLKGGREMRLAKLAGMRRLSLGKQVLRTAAEAVGFLLFLTGTTLATESLLTNQASIPFWPSFGVGVVGYTLMELVSDEVPTRHLNRWQASVRGSEK